MEFRHYPPVDERGAERLRVAAVAWAPLLGALHSAGFRPYLELQHGQAEDPLRIYCELDDDLLLDLSIEDGGIPDTAPEWLDGEWAAFVQDADGDYLAEILIDAGTDYRALAGKLRDLIDSVAVGERPMFEIW